MDTKGDSTMSERTPPPSGERRGSITVAFSSHRPTEGAARFVLDVDEVILGRGDTFEHERAVTGKRRVLVLRFDDPRVSSLHARLVRGGGRWNVEDNQSKNGTLIDGARVGFAPLADGAVIEVGGTFLVFRDVAPGIHAGDRTAETIADLGVCTLHPSFDSDLHQLALVARAQIAVLLLGESGTGKEVLARGIHAASGRPGAFQAINCGALPDTLLLTELFGYKKGAFSGAFEDRLGLVRSADRGTLFLDEIGDLPAPSQAALLRVLQEREVTPIGATRGVPVDIRVLAATHRDLPQLVADGAFREDLLARLSGFEIALPPLRDRIEDLGTLVGTLIRRLAPERAQTLSFTRRAGRALHAHTWPKNVRELEKCLETALVLAGDEPIDVGHLPLAVRALEAPERGGRVPSTHPPGSMPPSSLNAEDAALRADLERLFTTHEGNISAVAREMGKARVQIQRWVKRFGFDPESFKRG